MSGLFYCNLKAADHDDIRDADYLISYAHTKVHCVHRSNRYLDFVQLVRHAWHLAMIRLL